MERLFWVEGVREELVFSALNSITEEHGSKWFEETAGLLLRGLGYTIERQVWVPNRGDGFRGRVDLVAAKPFTILAIEFDNCLPRKKSIFKVKQVPGATMRLVYCRRVMSEDRSRKYQARLRKRWGDGGGSF